MRIYNEKRRHPFKWVVAIIIFILAMTVTFEDVFGVWMPGQNDAGQKKQPSQRPDDRKGTETIQADFESTPPPPQVPEPGTLILLGSGLAAMHMLRKRKASK